MTSPKQISLFIEERSTLSQEDSLVNPTHPQESDSAKKMRDISGRKCLEQFEKFPQVGSWARTFAALLIGMEGWYSMRCKLTWKLSATKSSRFYFQLVPSTLRTEEIGYGLLPTPLAQAREETNFEAYDQRMQRLVEKGHKPFTMPLDQMAMRGLLPTPMTQQRNTTIDQTMERQKKYGGKTRAMYLENFAVMGMLPTPTVNDMKNASLPPSQANRNDSIVKRILEQDSEVGKTSQLNPRFVLEMMGFPPDWTELPFLNGETNPSKQEAMQ